MFLSLIVAGVGLGLSLNSLSPLVFTPLKLYLGLEPFPLDPEVVLGDAGGVETGVAACWLSTLFPLLLLLKQAVGCCERHDVVFVSLDDGRLYVKPHRNSTFQLCR